MRIKAELTIKIEVGELRGKLEKMITSEHSPLIAKIIIANLQRTEVGLEQLFAALSGIERTAKFRILDTVRIPKGAVYSWEYDEPNTTKAGLLQKEEFAGVVTNVDLQRSAPYEVKVNMRDSSDKPITRNVWVPEESIILESHTLI